MTSAPAAPPARDPGPARTAASAATSAVALRGVRRALGGRAVLDGVTLEAARGRILVLLGPSGAGKTTLLRIVAGLDDPDEGVVEVGGRVVAAPRSVVAPHERGVGMVFQTLELWPHLSAAENVAFGLSGRTSGRGAARHPRVLEVAAEVGLPAALLSRLPPTLSGGERQRVAIARALAPRPAVLLYDEPLANLDPARRQEIRALVRALAKTTGTSAIYVTHDPEEALEVGDDLVVLAAGRVIERGAPADVYQRPSSLAGARALGPVSALRGGLLAGSSDVAECAMGAVLVAVSPGVASGRGLVLLRPEQVRLADVGATARVVDAHPVVAGHAFTARLDGGEMIEGRASCGLTPGAAVRVAVDGPGTLVAADPEVLS